MIQFFGNFSSVGNKRSNASWVRFSSCKANDQSTAPKRGERLGPPGIPAHDAETQPGWLVERLFPASCWAVLGFPSHALTCVVRGVNAGCAIMRFSLPIGPAGADARRYFRVTPLFRF